MTGEHGMILMNIDPAVLTIHVVIVSLSTVGVVEWLKNKFKCKDKSNYAIVALFVLAVCVVIQLPFVPPVITTGYNLFMLGLAFVQLSHVTLVKVPEAMINKAFGVKQ